MTPTAFISYSHDSGHHEDRVVALADQLRTDGVDVRIDQYELSPAEGWPRWVERQIATCTFAVLVFTPTYRKRYDLAQTHETAEPDDRATWETMTVRHLLYAAGGHNTKVIPALFEGSIEETIPLALRGSTSYRLPAGYEDLLRRLLNQPRRPPPPLGPRRTLAPDPRPSFHDLMQPEAPASGGPPVEVQAEPTMPTATSKSTAREGHGSTLTLPATPDRPLTLVVFMANGASARARLRLDTELKAIKLAVGRHCRLIVSPTASFGDVVRDLDAHRPTLVHFCGHTDHASGHLVLDSEFAGDEVFVSPQQLADLLAEIRPAPVLVTFTACVSTTLAAAAAQHARFAIGFEEELDDEWAPLFSATLYERLTTQARLDVPRALRMTKLAWRSEGRDVAEMARLYCGPEDESGDRGRAPRPTIMGPRDDGETPDVDVLIVTALREELDALLGVTAGLRESWTRVDGDPPRHVATFEGKHGELRVTAVRLTKMAGSETAMAVAPLLDAMAPQSLAMCGVCAGHPEDTDRGDVVIAERVFQYDYGKLKEGGFQGDLWVSSMAEPWLHAAQDLVGSADGMHGYAPATEAEGRWWFLEQLHDERKPLHSSALRRYIPDSRRDLVLESLQSDGLVTLHGGVFTLTHAGQEAIANHRVVHGQLVQHAPYHVHVGPMGSGNAVVADGEIWGRLARGGMRKTLGVEMEAATIGQLAHKHGIPFAVAKSVMDHADTHKSDRFKAFAARAAAEVLCTLLRQVVVPR